MNTLRWPAALLWDVDGTLAETERDGHRVAFNEAFAAMRLPWHWDVAHYGALLAVTGGRERLLHDMQSRPEAPAQPEARDALARMLHALKNSAYAQRVADGALVLRPGVLNLLRAARQAGLPMGIATTTSQANVAALLGAALGADWRAGFAVCVCGEDVHAKKPDPEVYLRAVQALGCALGAALAIEDSPAGVQAACQAGVPVIVTRSVYFADADVRGALAVGPGLHIRTGWEPAPPGTGTGLDAGIGLEDLAHWMAATR